MDQLGGERRVKEFKHCDTHYRQVGLSRRSFYACNHWIRDNEPASLTDISECESIEYPKSYQPTRTSARWYYALFSNNCWSYVATCCMVGVILWTDFCWAHQCTYQCSSPSLKYHRNVELTHTGGTFQYQESENELINTLGRIGGQINSDRHSSTLHSPNPSWLAVNLSCYHSL